MADVITIVADGIATWLECFPRQIFITLVADVKAMGHYFSLSSMLLIRTSSHM